MHATDSTLPYWFDAVSARDVAPLSASTSADVVVVGGGITGVTTAYLLARAGINVILLERRSVAAADTGHTSAHLTMVTDLRLPDLVKQFGRTHAQAVWDAGLAAMTRIADIVDEHAIEADFAWINGYLHAALDEDQSPRDLSDDVALASELGFDAESIEQVPLVHRPGVCFRGQGRLHPRKYLAGVAQAFIAAGGRIFSDSAVEDFMDSPRQVVANGHRVTCSSVVIATHNPIVGFGRIAGATLFQTKLALYTTYVVAGRVEHGTVPDALWWDTADPYHYLRIDPGERSDLVILGGGDHKTGQEPATSNCYQQLAQRLVALVPGIRMTHRWSGQVIETADGLPYIGETAPGQYSATGFSGNGLTFGTLAGMMISDAILRRTNPWSDLFHPNRKALTHGLWDYVKENADYPYYLMRSWIAGPARRSLSTLARGHGSVIEHDGRKVAAYRAPDGALSVRSAICTHMGCVVTWNATEKTWDCPCHGSRFDTAGQVLSGPAERPLSPADDGSR